MGNLGTQFADWLVRNGTIESEDAEIYAFGFKQGCIQLVSIVFVLLLGVLSHKTLELFSFLLSFIPLRIYAGGYHSRSSVVCGFLSIGVCFLVIFLSTWVVLIPFVVSVLQLFLGIYIYKKAPVDSENHRLSANEKSVFKTRSKYILIAEYILMIALSILGAKQIASGIACTNIIMSGSLFLGSLNNPVD